MHIRGIPGAMAASQKSLNFTNRTNSIFPFGQFDLSTERTIPSVRKISVE
jgi:hypothetical protein